MSLLEHAPRVSAPFEEHARTRHPSAHGAEAKLVGDGEDSKPTHPLEEESCWGSAQHTAYTQMMESMFSQSCSWQSAVHWCAAVP
eukprot:586478-Rhodomonas_salina.1